MIRRGSVFGVSVRSGGFLGFCSMGRVFVGVQVVRWAAGCVLRFSLWSAAVLRFLGVRCYRIGFPFWVLSKFFDTLRCYNPLLVPLVVMQYCITTYFNHSFTHHPPINPKPHSQIHSTSPHPHSPSQCHFSTHYHSVLPLSICNTVTFL